MKMWVYVARRLLLVIPVVIGVMTITFFLLHLEPVANIVLTYGSGKTLHPGTPLWNYYINRLGLNKPVPVQWGLYIYHSLTLQWGFTSPKSIASSGARLGGVPYPVNEVLSWYLPYTLELAALSLLIILLLAIPLGNYSAVYRNRPLDQGTRVMSFSGYALPSFILASLVLIAAATLSGGAAPECHGTQTHFTDWYGSWPPGTCWPGGAYPSWIGSHFETYPTHFPTVDALINHDPTMALDSIERMMFPALVIAFGYVASILRFVRNSMLEVMNLDFVRTARAKGVPERQVVSRHAGRNSLNVTVTVLGLTFAYFITGFPVVEEIFNLRGVGYMLALSIQQPLDLGLIFGSTLLLTLIVVIANIVVDLLYAYLDPRVRLG
jgi:peptide/nickel transport system permease protein